MSIYYYIKFDVLTLNYAEISDILEDRIFIINSRSLYKFYKQTQSRELNIKNNRNRSHTHVLVQPAGRRLNPLRAQANVPAG